MVIKYGFGKVILFGEHFVVYGLPGIASRVDKNVTVIITKTKGVFKIKNAFFGNKNDDEIIIQLIKAMFPEIKLKDMTISISGDIIPKSGMGYSAALSVALAKAIANHKGISIKDINKIAFEAEKVSHGKPSGIDNSASTSDKPIWFENKTAKELHLKKEVIFVATFTNKFSSTKDLIIKTRKFLDNNLERFEEIKDLYQLIVFEARQALEKDEIEKLSILMRENHDLLKEIGASCPEIEDTIKESYEHGAIGSKLTGAGGGGWIISIVKNKADADELVDYFNSIGKESFIVKIK